MNDLIVTSVSNAATLHGALENLRANRMSCALESLEQGLDVTVVTLSALCDGVDASDRERAVQALRWVRDYRRDHPRRTETDLNSFNKDTVAGILKLQEEARKILDETK